MLFLDALRPPHGYVIDRVVGTTFSLDLVALLTVPLALTFQTWEGESGVAGLDPLALLEAVRRHADRLSLFCQAGQIAVPRQSNQPLLTYLEEAVVEVAPRGPGGVFHPKVWALRFTSPDAPVLYRLLVSSRNLTFDRSWDTLLVLEDAVAPRRNAYANRHDVGRFFEALPSLAVRRPVPERILQDVALVQSELRRVRFAKLPAGFDELRFHPMGVGRGPRWPFEGRIDRMLAVSPFVEPSCLGRLAKRGRGDVLVSRAEELDRFSEGELGGWDRVCVLREEALAEPSDAPCEPASESEEVVPPADIPLEGLHAKVYVADAGWHARLWTGSANATGAAFGSNVEFLVELSGKKSVCGIDAVLNGARDRGGLASLLRDYATTRPPQPVDPEKETLARLLEKAKRSLATSDLAVRVSVSARDAFRLELRCRTDAFPRLPSGVTVTWRPVTLRAEQAVPAAFPRPGEQPSAVLACVGPVTLVAITSFFVFEVTATYRPNEPTRFVLNLRLEGEPGGRREAVLRALLEPPEAVRRYILMLLSADSADTGALERMSRMLALGSHSAEDPWNEPPLFEALVRTLARDPERLDDIARVIEALGVEGAERLPAGFDSVWCPVWRVREGMRDGE